MQDAESEIDNPEFFLAKDGKFNAQSELDATITALYNETRFDSNSTACLFPARVFWLKSELGLKDLPEVQCEDFEYFLNKLQPESVSLVFPFTQGSSASSMFGHTFLRIGSPNKPRLLSYAFNYAARINEEDDQLRYTYKGFFGGYKGEYSLMPYYEKIKEYRDIEERDVWEYNLNFTKDETMQMLRHMWEIEFATSRYYFFTKNCSYKMLWVMESAREGLSLRDYFNFHVIPSESIRASIDEGLVSSVNYRPSRGTKLLAYEKLLNDEQIQNIINISTNALAPEEFIKDESLDLQTKRYVLDASSEFIEYDYLKKDINTSVYKTRLYTILKSRAGLGKGETLHTSTPVDPMLSHRAFRITSEVGVRNSEPIVFVGWRPASHDINDFDVGLIRGTQIEFMDMLFSYSKNDFNVEKVTFLSLVTLIPDTEFFHQETWGFSIGFDNNYLTESTKFTSHYSLGKAWGTDFFYVYALADVIAYNDRDMTVGIGAIAGAALYQSQDFKMNVEVTQRLYDTGYPQLLASLSQHYRPTSDTSVSLSYDYVQKYAQDWDTFKLTFDYFF